VAASGAQDKAQLVLGGSVKELCARLSGAVAALCGLSDADLQEERVREQEHPAAGAQQQQPFCHLC
jgi:hypothetical protein